MTAIFTSVLFLHSSNFAVIKSVIYSVISKSLHFLTGISNLLQSVIRQLWKWTSRPTIDDGQGQAMDRGGEEAPKEMGLKANERLVEVLWNQITHLFTNLTQKQEEDNCSRRLREENVAIRRQMLELEKEKLEPNNRVGQLMIALLGQMRGDRSPPMSTPVGAEVVWEEQGG